jgi:cytoskeletal protein CcmA (bactofilin family)
VGKNLDAEGGASATVTPQFVAPAHSSVTSTTNNSLSPPVCTVPVEANCKTDTLEATATVASKVLVNNTLEATATVVGNVEGNNTLEATATVVGSVEVINTLEATATVVGNVEGNNTLEATATVVGSVEVNNTLEATATVVGSVEVNNTLEATATVVGRANCKTDTLEATATVASKVVVNNTLEATATVVGYVEGNNTLEATATVVGSVEVNNTLEATATVVGNVEVNNTQEATATVVGTDITLLAQEVKEALAVWQVGAVVRIIGLTKASHLNGKTGRVSTTGWLTRDGHIRVGVELDDSQRLAVRHDNLELVESRRPLGLHVQPSLGRGSVPVQEGTLQGAVLAHPTISISNRSPVPPPVCTGATCTEDTTQGSRQGSTRGPQSEQERETTQGSTPVTGQGPTPAAVQGSGQAVQPPACTLRTTARPTLGSLPRPPTVAPTGMDPSTISSLVSSPSSNPTQVSTRGVGVQGTRKRTSQQDVRKAKAAEEKARCNLRLVRRAAHEGQIREKIEAQARTDWRCWEAERELWRCWKGPPDVEHQLQAGPVRKGELVIHPDCDHWSHTTSLPPTSTSTSSTNTSTTTTSTNTSTSTTTTTTATTTSSHGHDQPRGLAPSSSWSGPSVQSSATIKPLVKHPELNPMVQARDGIVSVTLDVPTTMVRPPVPPHYTIRVLTHPTPTHSSGVPPTARSPLFTIRILTHHTPVYTTTDTVSPSSSLSDPSDQPSATIKPLVMHTDLNPSMKARDGTVPVAAGGPPTPPYYTIRVLTHLTPTHSSGVPPTPRSPLFTIRVLNISNTNTSRQAVTERYMAYLPGSEPRV